MTARSRRRRARLACAVAHQDARHLALELAGRRPTPPIDVMRLGIVIEPGETAYRYVHATISQYHSNIGGWPIPTPVAVLITDRRMLLRLPHGAVIPLWWHCVLALDVDLAVGRVVLDYGDNQPRAIGGPAVATLAVMSIGAIFGLDGLTRHPSLIPLRGTRRGETGHCGLP